MFKVPENLRNSFFPVGKGGVFHGNALELLKALPDRVVQCCVTSPPYWPLKDYGVRGQSGLEETPDEYVEKLNAVFHEVRRVLKDDGTLWLNFGDTYCRGWMHCGVKTKELIGKIELYVNTYNKDSHPFSWTATADSIMAKFKDFVNFFRRHNTRLFCSAFLAPGSTIGQPR